MKTVFCGLPTHFRFIPIALAAACASGDSVDDASLGIRIDTVDGVPRTTSPEAGIWAPGEAWSVGQPTLRLGGPDAPIESSWGSVTGAVVNAEGILYVADSQAREIRRFDATGRYLDTFGGEGEGPGEFRFIDALTISPDGILAVRDPLARRLTLFDSEGAYLHSFALERESRLRFGADPDLWIDRDHRIYDPFPIESDEDDPDGGTRGLGFVMYDSLGTIVDSLQTVAWGSTTESVVDSEGRRMEFSVPFATSGTATIHPDGFAIAAVSDVFRLQWFAPEGSLVRVFDVDADPVSLTPEDRTDATGSLEDQLEMAREMIGFAVTETPDVGLPDVRPYLGDLHVDLYGNVWAAEYVLPGSEPTRFHIFDPDGRLLGVVEVPDMTIAHIGTDWIVGVEEDELEVEYVVVAPIVR